VLCLRQALRGGAAIPVLGLGRVAPDADAGEVGVGELELGRRHAALGRDVEPFDGGLDVALVGGLVASRWQARDLVAERQRRLGHAVLLRLHQPALAGRDVALDAEALAQGEAVAQPGQRVALLGGAAIEVGGAHRVGRDHVRALVEGAAERVHRLRVAAGRGLLEPCPRRHQVARHALAAQVQDAEVDLGARVARGGGLLEQFDGLRLVARLAGETEGIDQREAMVALDRAGIGSALDRAQALAALAAIEQDGAEPSLGLGIAGGKRLQGGFGSGEIAGTVGTDGGTQRRRHVGGGGRLRARGAARGQQGHKQRRSPVDHFVLKV